TQQEMADELGVSQSQISRDLDALIVRWKESAFADTATHLAQEVQRLNRLERQYQDAWMSSQEGRVSKQTRAGGRGAPWNLLAEMRTEKRDGDPRFLDGVLRCIQLRSRLLGLLDKDPTDPRDATAQQILVIEPKLTFDPPVEGAQHSGN